MEPGAERRRAAERAELLPGADEDILGQLVDVAPRRHPPDEAVNLRQVRAIEGFERPNVSRRGGRHVVGYSIFGSRTGAVRPLLALERQRLCPRVRAPDGGSSSSSAPGWTDIPS